jgi:predicted molibdopterin-dependent oxidoreductase YjgC
MEHQNLNIEVNGQAILARPGQTVGAALMSAGLRVLRRSPQGQPRGLFCGMGVCFECLVTIDDLPGQRACITPVRPGMQILLPVETPTIDGDH